MGTRGEGEVFGGCGGLGFSRRRGGAERGERGRQEKFLRGASDFGVGWGGIRGVDHPGGMKACVSRGVFLRVECFHGEAADPLHGFASSGYSRAPIREAIPIRPHSSSTPPSPQKNPSLVVLFSPPPRLREKPKPVRPPNAFPLSLNPKPRERPGGQSHILSGCSKNYDNLRD